MPFIPAPHFNLYFPLTMTMDQIFSNQQLIHFVMQVMLDDKRLLKAFYITRVGCFLPLCTLYGGFMAQEVIKALSGKFSPLKQWVSSFTLLLLLTMLLFQFFWGKFISWILVPIIPVLKLMCGLTSQTRYGWMDGFITITDIIKTMLSRNSVLILAQTEVIYKCPG